MGTFHSAGGGVVYHAHRIEEDDISVSFFTHKASANPAQLFFGVLSFHQMFYWSRDIERWEVEQ